MERVATFTDTYLPTVNGVTYTVTTWRDHWLARGGHMRVVYPSADGHDPGPTETPVRSLPFPFYDGYRLGLPVVPGSIKRDGHDVVHVHTPFSIGWAGLRFARQRSLPAVASYHTPTAEYTRYIAPTRRIAAWLRRVSTRWERRFLDRVDRVLVPSESTKAALEANGVRTPVEVVPNGIDTDHFRPVRPDEFLGRHGLDAVDRLVGYTGRHGFEKRLGDLIDVAAGLEATVVLAGDGPARADLERRADDHGVDVRFLGFLDRDDLPAFYSALDVFAFPSPVETQGVVALEAMACGTPVVGADRGALAETIETGTTGYHFTPGEVDGFRRGIERALDEEARLSAACLARREGMQVERTVDRLESVYASLA